MPEAHLRSGVIGWPINHSKSPLIHSYWLNKYDLSGSYDLIPLHPDQAETFFKDFAKSGLIGANVTVPYKEVAFHCIAETDEATQRLGAINTIYMRNGKLCATSTDGYGFLAHLKSMIPGLDLTQKRVVILGAGGAARSIIGALTDQGVAEICITNRTRERADELAKDMAIPLVVCNWEQRTEILQDASLLVNTTSLGMQGKPELDISLDQMPEGSCVYDIVYNPLETDLLKSAARQNLQCVDGLGMLLHQAVPGFELWFGVRPEVTPELRTLLIDSLSGTQT